MTDLTTRLRARIKHAAWDIALDAHNRGITPAGMTGKQHADSLIDTALTLIQQTVAYGGMAWVDAAERITGELEQQAKGKA